MSENSLGKLSKIAEVVMGQSPSGKTCNKNEVGTPLLNGPTEFGSHHPFPVQYTTDPQKLAKPGDLLFCVRGSTTGRMNWADREYAIGRGIAAIRSRNGQNLAPFIRASIELQLPKLLNITSGSTFPNVSSSQLQNLLVFIPPLPTQRRIAEILGRLDDKIEVNRRINRTLEAMAQALFQHHFVDFGPYQDELMESEAGLIPRGWEVGTVEDVLELAYGKGLTEKERIPGPYPVFGSSGQVGTHSHYLIEAPGIIVGRKGTIGKLSWAQENFWPIDTTYYVVPKRQAYSLEFIFHVLDSLNLESRNNDSAVPGLNRNNTYRLPVVIPSDKVLQWFDCTVKPWFKQIDLNNQEIVKLAEIRDYLLPRLLSGKVEAF